MIVCARRLIGFAIVRRSLEQEKYPEIMMKILTADVQKQSKKRSTV